MTKSNKSKVSKKKPCIPLYRIKLLERNIIRNAQNYYYNSKIIPPVGNPNTWNIEEESVFEEDKIDYFGIGINLKEDMSFLYKIQK